MPKITLKYVWSEKVKALPYYWIGQKVHLGFSARCFSGKFFILKVLL